MQLNRKEIAATLEYTRVKATDSLAEVQKIAAEAVEYGFGAICVTPFFVEKAHALLCGSNVELCTGIGFPIGANIIDTKVQEMKQVIRRGADAVDFVINIGALKSGMYDVIECELRALVHESGNAITKVIIETCYLTNEEIFKVSRMAADIGVQYIKTSTGMGTRGASLEDIRIIKEAVKGKCKIKASAGIRNLAQTLEMLEAGAHRIGTSQAVEIIKEIAE